MSIATIKNVVLTNLVLLAAVACGPGRQASWEKESASKQQVTPEASAPASQDNDAEAAWASRSTKAELEKALVIWESELAKAPENADVLTKLARGYYFLADAHLRFENNADVLLATYEKGIQAGERAMMAVSPEFSKQVKAGTKVEEAVKVIPQSGQSAIYWYATNLGRFAVQKGFTTLLFYKDRIYAVMQQVLALDETFFHGAPHRYFGAFYAKAPSFAGGDLANSEEHFKKALEIAPLYLGTKTLYAEFYATKADKRDLFESLLKEVVAGDADAIAGIAPEQKVEQQKAEQLLEDAEELF